MELIENLPVFREFKEIKKAWDEKTHLILKSPTGSGKSIALPYLLKNSGLVGGKIFVAQPRRIAARLLCKTLAKMVNWTEGNEVGYQVRFDKKYCKKTQIIYATDGVVFNKLLRLEDLEDIEVLILDEFHERSAFIDLSLALALKIAKTQKRKLRIIVTSATLDIDRLEQFIPDVASVELTGRSFPVEIEHRAVAKDNPMWRSVAEVIPSLLDKREGDILIFMDGAYEISRLINTILSSPWSKNLEVRPLYGDLSPEKQDRALMPADRRRIIVSTNIAETSLTIEGIKIVIDCGKAKKMSYDSSRGINALLSEPICRSSADQRAGRAGRLGPGFCLRFWSKAEHVDRIEFDIPEITAIDLSEIYLNLAKFNLKLEHINLLEPVSSVSIDYAKQKLRNLGAMNDQENLTEHGIEMAQLPINPTWAHALLVAKRNKMESVIALVLAMLEGRPLIQSNSLGDFFPLRNPRSDVYCLLLAFEEGARRNFSVPECRKLGIHAGRCREAELLARELSKFIGISFHLQLPDYTSFAKTLLQCFPNQVAQLVSDGRKIYQDYDGRRLHLSNHSVMGSEKFVLPLQTVEKRLKGRIVLEMEWGSGMDESWLREVLGTKMVSSMDIVLDLNSKKVVKRKMERFGNLVLSISESEEISKNERAKAFAKSITDNNIKLKNWNAQVDKLLHRQRFLATKFPDLGIIEMDEETKGLFLEELCENTTSWREIKNLEIYTPLLNCFSAEEREVIDKATPENFDLGNGRHPYSLDYSQKSEVVLRAKLQDLYDVNTHPTIVYGKYPLVVEILAPNRRPVQRTQDLPGFWKGSYPTIRKDLAGRYPKHEWR